MVGNRSLETEEGDLPLCSKEEDWHHVLRCEGTTIWRDEIFNNRFRNLDGEIGIRSIVECKNEEQ